MHLLAVLAPTLGQLGATDCEAFEGGLLAQTTNALTSLAYVVIGAFLIVDGLRRSGEATIARVVFGLTVAAVGIGSVLFHGPAWPGSRWVHDVAILAAFGFIAVYSLGLAIGWPTRRTLTVFAAGLVALGAIIAVAPDSSIPLTGLVAVGAMASEVLAWRRGCRRADGRFASPAYWLALGLLGTGAAINAVSRTGGSLCQPDNWFQGHGAWHVLTALAFGAWAIDGLARSRPQDT